MLQLKNIVKSYTVGELTQVALKGISLNFRDNEFVSILGQSGSGKTTMCQKMLTSSIAANNQAIIIDPQAEYLD